MSLAYACFNVVECAGVRFRHHCHELPEAYRITQDSRFKAQDSRFKAQDSEFFEFLPEAYRITPRSRHLTDQFLTLIRSRPPLEYFGHHSAKLVSCDAT